MTPLIKEQKKREDINNCCSFKDSSIFNLEFSVDNFIQLLSISYLLKGTGKYGIYYKAAAICTIVSIYTVKIGFSAIYTTYCK